MCLYNQLCISSVYCGKKDIQLVRWPKSVTAKQRLTAKHRELTAKHSELTARHRELTAKHNQLTAKHNQLKAKQREQVTAEVRSDGGSK